MDRQTRPLKPSFHPASPSVRRLGRGVVAAALLGIAAIGGCSWLEQGKLERYQSENERLIGDFRSERKRNSVLDERNEALSDRVAHLENRLAAVSDSLREETIDESGRPKTPASEDSTASAAASAPSPEAPESPSKRLFAPFERWRGRP